MLKKDAINEILRRTKNYLQLQFHVKQIGLFGSYLRNEQHEKSDVDILVEFEKGHKDFFNYLLLNIFSQH